MYVLLLTTIISMPPPAWLADPMPPPNFAVAARPVEVKVELIKPKRPPLLKRLPGPRNLFRCPHCGASDCLMFLGQVLRNSHKVSDEYLDRLGPRQWGVLYDNIINSRKPAVTVQSDCPGGVCPAPTRRFLFRPWRR